MPPAGVDVLQLGCIVQRVHGKEVGAGRALTQLPPSVHEARSEGLKILTVYLDLKLKNLAVYFATARSTPWTLGFFNDFGNEFPIPHEGMCKKAQKIMVFLRISRKLSKK